MADRVDTAMHRVQATALEPVADRPPAESEVDQLHPCDHPVLARRKLSDRPVGCPRSTFGPYDGPNCTFDAHLRSIACEMRQRSPMRYGFTPGGLRRAAAGPGLPRRPS